VRGNARTRAVPSWGGVPWHVRRQPIPEGAVVPGTSSPDTGRVARQMWAVACVRTLGQPRPVATAGARRSAAS
jgi:hypothetical protein